MNADNDLFAQMDMATDLGTALDADFERAMLDPFKIDANLSGEQADVTLDGHLLATHRPRRQRTFISLSKEPLQAFLPGLPDEGETWWIVSSGDGKETRLGAGLKAQGFDFGSFALYAADLMGSGSHLYVSTWIANLPHVTAFCDMLANGQLDTLTFVSDPFFSRKRTTAYVWNTLIERLAAFPDRARVAAFANHTKLTLICNADESRCLTVAGSANFSAVARCEQYTLSGDPALFRFMRDEFFEKMIRKVTRR